MNLSEFKAWFEGFTDGMESNLSEKQWAKIKEKIGEIKPEPTSPTVIREYINSYRRYWNEPYWYGHLQPYAISGMQGATANCAIPLSEKLSGGDRTVVEKDFGYTPLVNATFRAMGTADAAEIN